MSIRSLLDNHHSQAFSSHKIPIPSHSPWHLLGRPSHVGIHLEKTCQELQEAVAIGLAPVEPVESVNFAGQPENHRKISGKSCGFLSFLWQENGDNKPIYMYI
jgi:hypothetical protein